MSSGSLICRLRGHAPGDEQVENRGFVFARCRRCGADLVRKGGRWHPVPKNYRVVWRAAEPEVPRATILVCDDDPLTRELLEYRLSGRGYRVELARDGAEALASVARGPPDAVLLDAMMPNIDGYEVLRRLREAESTRRLPIIMLTARRQERDVVDALLLGADDFISKPFIPEELLTRLARLLAKERV